MARFDDGLTDLLYAVTRDAPPSRVDLGAVLTDGRRRRRRRAVVTPLLVAAAVLGVAAGGLVAANLRPTGQAPVPPGSAAPTTSAPTAPANTVPTQFPLDRQLFVLDDTLGLALTGVSLTSDTTFLQYGGALGNGITVWVLAAGTENTWLSDPSYDVTDAPPVDGRPASFLWLPADPAPDGDPPLLKGIAFRWAPDAWAAVFHVPGPGNEALLVTLAESLHRVDEPALVGLRVSPPPGLRLVETMPVGEGAEGPGLFTGLWFELGPPTQGSPANRPTVLVKVDYDDIQWVGEGVPMVANTDVQGHPAYVDDRTEAYNPFYSIDLLDEGRPVVSVSVSGDGALDLFGPDDANALALSVEPLGTWEDRSQWTDHPIR